MPKYRNSTPKWHGLRPPQVLGLITLLVPSHKAVYRRDLG